MSRHSEAAEAYKTLAEYMQKNCVREMKNVKYPWEVCERCPFFYSKYTCLIQRLGTFPELALEDDTLEGIKEKVKELERGDEK